MLLKFFLSLLLILNLLHAIQSKDEQGDNKKPTIFTKKISKDIIKLDGYLDENEWNLVLPANNFIQRDPTEGEPSTEKTEVYILYDEENLYIGAMLYDSDPEGILAYQKRRDQSLRTDDRFMWILDTFSDGRTGYFFEVNPAGLMGDGLIIGSGSYWGINKDWNGIWDTRVVVVPNGWSIEVAIPFRTLNFDPNLDTWGVNFQRTIRRKNEDSKWTGYERNKKLTEPIHGGRLSGLNGLTQGRGFELKPYISLNNNNSTIDEKMITDNLRDIGFDVSMNISSALKLSFTYNTDFAEAEVDQRRVNLTRFPLRYAEKRGFFLEGAGVYSFSPRNDVTPFFSRRIGISGGKQIPINAGAKLSGQIGNYEIGFIQTQTRSIDNIKGENFSVARVKRPFLKQSYLGLVFTDRSTRDGDIDSLSLDQTLYGADLELKTSEFLGDKNLQFQSFFVFHSAPMFNNDLSISDLSTRGLRITYPNDIIRTHVSYREFGDMYSPSLGFSRRNGFKRIQPSFSYNPRPQKFDFIRQIEIGISYENMTDLNDRMLKKQTTLTPFNIRFESQDEIGIKIVNLKEYLDEPFIIYDNISIPINEYNSQELQFSFQSSEKRMLSTEFEYQTGDFWTGKKQTLSAEISLKPFSGVSIISEYEKNQVKLSDNNFSTEVYNIELGVYPTPRTAFFSNFQYDDVSNALGLFAKLQHTMTPGSDLYLVYTHNWTSLSESIFDFNLKTFSKISSFKINYTIRL